MPRAGRIEAFDLLRAAAIFGVVWIHGCDTSAWALRMSRYASISVPLFILISFFLLQHSALRHPEAGLGQTLRKRLGRLLPAYAFWSAAYVAVRLAKHAVLPAESAAGLDPVSVVFLGGASYQIYFIAALIYWSVLSLPAILFFGRHPRRRAPGAALLAAAGAGLLWAGGQILPRLDIAPQHSLFAHALLLTGYVPLGMALALWSPAGSKRRAVAWICGGAAVALVAFDPAWGLPALLSVVLVLWATTCEGAPMPPWIRRISALSYGIYFVHGFIVEGLQFVAARVGWSLETGGAAGGLMVLAFAWSWLACEILYRAPRLRGLVS